MSDLSLRINIRGDVEVGRRFERAGDAVREAVKGVFTGVGQEIVSAAQAAIPSRRARNAIYFRIVDGAQNKGAGRIRLIVNTQRRFRWVQQFEFGTVGTRDDEAQTGEVWMGVRSHRRRVRSRDVRRPTYKGGRWRMQRVAAGFITVKSYSHRFHMPTRPFMGPAFRSVEPTIVPRIEKAVDTAIGFGGRR